MAYPEGYRKAMRVMALADRHAFPLVSLVDTPGAYPGVAAEQHGQAGAIARSQAAMVRLGVPTVAVVIGEGGSGGAIATAVADRVLMQENAIYTRHLARGLRRDPVARRLAGQEGSVGVQARRSALPRAGGDRRHRARARRGAHLDPEAAAGLLREAVSSHLDDIADRPIDDLRRSRRAKFRSMGVLGDARLDRICLPVFSAGEQPRLAQTAGWRGALHTFHRLIPCAETSLCRGNRTECDVRVKNKCRSWVSSNSKPALELSLPPRS